MLAMILAIGMSFASVKTDVFQAKDYAYLGSGAWQEIDEVNCGVGSIACSVRFGVNGPVYPVYDEQKLSTRKMGNTTEPIIVNP